MYFFLIPKITVFLGVRPLKKLVKCKIIRIFGLNITQFQYIRSIIIIIIFILIDLRIVVFTNPILSNYILTQFNVIISLGTVLLL